MDALATMDSNSMTGAMQVASTLAKSGLIPRALQGKPQDVLVVLLTGRELGLGPMQSLRGIHVVDGKAVLAADLIVGLCVRERSVCRYFRLVESTDETALYETHREGAPEPTRLAFTKAQAQAAGLLGKDNWRKYMAAMLRARAAAALARAVYPDLMAGVYESDELEHPKPEAAAPSPAPRPQRKADAEAEVVPEGYVATPPPPALPEDTGTLRAPNQAVAREAQQEAVQRVQRHLGGEVQRERQPGEDDAPTSLSFGPWRGRLVSSLTDAEVSAAVDMANAKLQESPKAKWVPSVQLQLAALMAEVELRQKALAAAPF